MRIRNRETRPENFLGTWGITPKLRRGKLAIATALMVAGGLSASASATTTLYWGSSGNTNTNWDTTATDVNWSPTSGGVASVAWTDGDAAVFGGTVTATVNGTVSADSMTLGTLTLAAGTGSATVDLGVGGLTDETSSNSSIGANIALEGSQTWTLNNKYNNLNVTGIISDGANGPAALTIDGLNSYYQNGMTLSAANTYSGGTTINAANVTISNNQALGTGVVTLGPEAGSPLQVTTLTANTASSAITIANNVDVNGAVAVNLGNTSSSNTFAIDGNITGGGVGSSISMATPNQFAFGGNNSDYVGTISVNQGVTLTSLAAGDANALWTGGNKYGPINISTGNAGTVSLGALSGGLPVQSHDGKAYTVEVGQAGLTESYSGNIGNVSYNNLALLLVGGQETFTGDSTYADGTVVQGGTLLVDNTTGSGTGTGSVTVDAAGTFGGSGIITGALTNDGTLQVGDAAGLSFHANGGTTLGNGSKLDFTLGTSGDLLDTTALTLGTGITLDVTPGVGFGTGIYQLIDFTGGLHNNSDNFTGWTVTGLAPGQTGIFSLTANALDLTVGNVPEPASLAMMAVLGTGLLLTGRRRKIA